MTVKEIVASKQCTGCGACSLVCPMGCITLLPDDEGFLAPSIASESCVECGACLQACHTKKRIPEVSPQGFVLLNQDPETRSESSSGGAFSALAVSVLERGGVVYGAAFDEILHVNHVRVADASELYRIQGSKYVQSETGDIYARVKRDLASGIDVCFSGTPCQVAGLKAYLGDGEPNLLTVDLVCHGVPSPGLWDEYVSEHCRKRESSPIAAKFRLKTRWERGSYALRIEDTKGVTSTPAKRDLYYALFLNGLDFRESCYTCPYASMRRPGDITVGDCNSIDCYPDFEPTEVVSIALVNNERGQRAWETLKGRVSYIPLDVKRESMSNAQLNHPFKRPSERDFIYDQLRNVPWRELRARYLEKPSFRALLGDAVRHLVPLSARVTLKRLLLRKERNVG